MVALSFTKWKKKYFKYDPTTYELTIGGPSGDGTISIKLFQNTENNDVDAAMKTFANTFYSIYLADETIKKARYGYNN